MTQNSDWRTKCTLNRQFPNLRLQFQSVALKTPPDLAIVLA
jgi:hypothetical protein